MSAEQHVTGGAPAQTTSAGSGRRFRFRDGIWDVISEQMGWSNIYVASKALNVADTTIRRGLERYPGAQLMAAVMVALPRNWKFEHVFELVDDTEPTRPFAGASGSRTGDAASGGARTTTGAPTTAASGEQVPA